MISREIYGKTLFQLPLLCRSVAGDILEVFLIKHSLVSSHYARLSFTQSFKQELDSNSSSSPECSHSAGLQADTVSRETFTPIKSIISSIYYLLLLKLDET